MGWARGAGLPRVRPGKALSAPMSRASLPPWDLGCPAHQKPGSPTARLLAGDPARGGLGRPAAPHGAAARWEGCAVGMGPDPAGRPRPGCSEAAAQGVPRGRCLAERSPTRSPGGADTEALSSRSCLCPATGHRARPSLRPLVPARAGLAGPLRAEEGGARAAGAAPPGLPSPPACGGTDPKPNRRKPGLPGTG